MWVGTNAERVGSFSTPVQEGLEFYETDTGELYKMIQQSWVQINSGGSSGSYLEIVNNLSDVADSTTALSNIGGEPDLGNPLVDGYVLSSTTGGVRSWVSNGASGAYLEIANNLSDVADSATSLSNIGGEPDLGNPLVDGYVLSSTTLGVRSWIEMTGTGGGVSQFTATIYADGDWDSEVIPIWQAPASSGGTITQVNATVMGASTPTLLFNLEKRAYNTLSSSGTEVFASDQTADADGFETTSFTSDTFSAKDFIVLTTPASAEGGVVSLIVVTVYFEV